MCSKRKRYYTVSCVCENLEGQKFECMVTDKEYEAQINYHDGPAGAVHECQGSEGGGQD